MIKPKQEPVSKSAAVDFLTITMALRDAGFTVKIAGVGSPNYVSADVWLEEGIQGSLDGRNERVGRVSVNVRGPFKGHDNANLEGVAVPIAIKLWGPSFQRYEQLGYAMNDPARTSAWIERGAKEIERQSQAMRDFDRMCGLPGEGAAR